MPRLLEAVLIGARRVQAAFSHSCTDLDELDGAGEREGTARARGGARSNTKSNLLPANRGAMRCLVLTQRMVVQSAARTSSSRVGAYKQAASPSIDAGHAITYLGSVALFCPRRVSTCGEFDPARSRRSSGSSLAAPCSSSDYLSRSRSRTLSARLSAGFSTRTL
eukprot:2813937-Rhodomonas_salina.6